MNFKLSPSDFAFLWDECKRCFYLKVARGFPPPQQPFPRIFGIIDEQMKNWFGGRRSETMAPGVPAGVVRFGDGWVESTPIRIKGRAATCYIRGIFDSVIELDGGGYAVIDFKTTQVRKPNLEKYGRQLHAYAQALENAAEGQTMLSPVRKLGLLVYEPDGFSQTDGDDERGPGASLGGRLVWHEIARDEKMFQRFLGQVLDVIEAAEPPPPSPGCAMCKYRDGARRTGW